MKVKHLGAGLVAVALGLAAPAWAGPDDDKSARDELRRAQQEVEKARAELQQATRELARSMAKVERDNPRAQYFEYMTNPNRAVLGVIIPDDHENGEMRGVRLLAVTPGTGAEQGGLKAGDLVTALNGNSLAGVGKTTPQLKMREQMKQLKAGDEVKVDFERDSRKRSATVKTTAPEPEIAMAPLPMIQEWIKDENFEKYGPMAAMPMFQQFRGPAIRGLELAKLDEDLGAYFKTRDGVLVVKAPKSDALGLKSGDVIQKIDGTVVAEPVTVLDKLRSRADEQNVKLEIMRQGRKQEITGKIPVADARVPRAHKEKHRRVEIIEHPDEDADDDGS